jgi:zinc transporter ZupT
MSTCLGFRRGVLYGVAVAAGLVAFHASAEAAFLRWASTHVKTNTTAKCFSFAQTALQSLSFTSIQKTASEVTGHKGAAFVAITCIGTTPEATAIVMVLDDNDNDAIQTRTAVVDKISKIIAFD